jgi:acyl-CoA synthetase (AMP-forming)/AMP-acid ligase II
VQAAVIGWPMEDGRALGLVGFVCGSVSSDEELRESARRLLPDYMVPSRILVLEEMPLNANGKIDRRALAAMLEETLVP